MKYIQILNVYSERLYGRANDMRKMIPAKTLLTLANGFDIQMNTGMNSAIERSKEVEQETAKCASMI